MKELNINKELFAVMQWKNLKLYKKDPIVLEKICSDTEQWRFLFYFFTYQSSSHDNMFLDFCIGFQVT